MFAKLEQITLADSYKPSTTSLHLQTCQEMHASLLHETSFARYDEISETFKDTYSWVFSKPSNFDPTWIDFREWLREGNDVY